MKLRSETINNIAPALLAAQKQMKDAVKDSNNPYFRSKFADLNSVREAVTPALHANGISILQLTGHTTFNAIPVVITTLLHESGEYISSETEIVCKEANNPQMYGSAVSYARRYGLSAMLSVGSVDDDAESAMSRNSTTKTTVATTNGTGTSKTTPASSSVTSFRKST